MSNLIGALRVDLDLRSAKFKRGMSDAQRRLKTLGRQFKLAAAGVVVLGSALSGVALKAGSAIDAFAKSARVMGTTTASMQVLSRAGELAGVSMGEIEAGALRLTRRLALAAQGAGPAAGAFDRLGLSITDLQAMPLDQRIATITTAIKDMIPASEQAAEMSKIFGDRGFAAFQKLQPEIIRQAAEEVNRFGVAVSDVDAGRIEVANDQISQLGLLARGIGNDLAVSLVPRIGATAAAFASAFEVGKPLRELFSGLIAQIPRLATYALTFTAVMGVRYVAALVAAKVATFSMAGALRVLRGALISTGIGALVVVAGELVYRFSELVRATGGVGNALRLLRDLAGEVWGRIGWHVDAAGMRAAAFGYTVKAEITSAMAEGLERVGEWANKTVGAFVGAGDAIAAIFKAIPGVVGEGAVNAANAVIDAIQQMLSKAATAFDSLTASMAASWVGEKLGITGTNLAASIDLAPLRNEWSGSLASMRESAVAAFTTAFNADYTGPLAEGMREIADTSRAMADAASDIGRHYAGLGRAPLKSVEALRDAVSGVGESAGEAAPATDALGESLGGSSGGGRSGSGGGVGGAAKAAAEKLSEAQKAAKDLADAFKGKVVSAIDGVSSAFGDFVVGGFRDFKGFVSNVLNSFKRMLSEMIAMAAKNRIMIGLGLAAPAAGGIAGAAQQALGGGGGGMLSGFLGKALGSWGGGTGILGGMGSVISPLFNGGGLSGAISGLGSALGGGLTSAIGGLIPVVGVAAAAFSFFKTKTKELNRGIEVSIKGTDAWTWQFKKMQKTRFWGLSKKTSTEWERASAQIAEPIKKAYLDIRRSTESMAKSIGASTRALNSYQKVISLDTKGMSPEEAQRALLEKMQGVSDDLASRVIGRRFARDGETATETLQAMAVSLGAINDAFRGLGLRAMRGGVVSANAARQIIEQVGGVQAFQQAADHYFGAFYSLPEQAKMIGQKLRAEMRAVGVAGSISTTAQFRAMVDRLNAQGRNAAAASLIALSPMFSQWKQLTEQVAANSGAELKAAQEAQKQRADLIAQQREGLMRRLYELLGNTVALRRMDLKALDPANHAYQRRIWQLEDEKKWLDKVNTARGEWSLDASKYATAAEAKMAAELREAKERDQKVIDAQNVELRRHSDLLAQVRDLLTRQTKNSDASLTLAQMG
ncbi:MAG: hypothetical protein CSA72_10595 [Rhodobacterales bacterium]|nr:MAG: hypothetical protein CSA72_10595 [Rhodobacterales bacterium]